MHDVEKAEAALEEALGLLELEKTGSGVSTVRMVARATVANNYAYHYRMVGKHAEALDLYMEAWELREAALGKAHTDCIATRHNVAELLLAMGQEESATAVQQGILDDLGRDPIQPP
jgi:tetratricopeptide (TPR) repeat protein